MTELPIKRRLRLAAVATLLETALEVVLRQDTQRQVQIEEAFRNQSPCIVGLSRSHCGRDGGGSNLSKARVNEALARGSRAIYNSLNSSVSTSDRQHAA